MLGRQAVARAIAYSIVEKVRSCTFSTRQVRRVSGLGFADQTFAIFDPRRVILDPRDRMPADILS